MQGLPLAALALVRVKSVRSGAAPFGVLIALAVTGVLLTLWLMP
jgi:hypothetical protein